ncbi:hypothetical protein C5167_041579 [Papaver somniferum]|nr:hypothetical protein C5167_041579 [Papaver somniferum]
MAKTKQTARKALQIPNLVDTVNAKVDKKTKDKVEITITPPSKAPRNDKYLLASPFARKKAE